MPAEATQALVASRVHCVARATTPTRRLVLRRLTTHHALALCVHPPGPTLPCSSPGDDQHPSGGESAHRLGLGHLGEVAHLSKGIPRAQHLPQ